MKAIYKGKLYSIIDDNGSEVKLQSLDTDMTLWASYGFGAPDFIIDPTCDEINNILPDYVPDDGADGFELPDGTPTTIGSVNLDQLIGCNMRGRLTYIRDLTKEMKNAEAIDEINKLLEFFPVVKL